MLLRRAARQNGMGGFAFRAVLACVLVGPGLVAVGTFMFLSRGLAVDVQESISERVTFELPGGNVNDADEDESNQPDLDTLYCADMHMRIHLT